VRGSGDLELLSHRYTALVIAALSCVPAAARAQEAGGGTDAALVLDAEAQEAAMARALFVDGVAQARQGSFHRAADFFRRAHELRPAPPVAYNLASALVQIGRLVEGTEILHWVARHRRTTPEMRAAARLTIRRIAPRLARIRVALSGAPGEVSLTLDERPLGRAVLGVMVPVDPGHHILAAHRGEERVAERELELEEGSEREIELAIPELGSQPLARSQPLRIGAHVPPPSEDLTWLLWTGVGVGVAVVIAVLAGVLATEGQGVAAAIPGTTSPPILEWR